MNSCLHGSEGAGTQQCVPATRLIVGPRSESAIVTLVERSTPLRLLAEPAGSVEHWGERALQRSLLATADRTARRIEAYAGDTANTPFQLVVGARRSLADIGAIRTRWEHATGTVPTPRPRPAPTARAGPPTTTVAFTGRAARATR